MRYYVIAEDGNRYGPADMALLETWAREGRITPTTFLEPELGGARVDAATMPTLQFPTVTAPYGSPGPYSPGSSPYPPSPSTPNYYGYGRAPMVQSYMGGTDLRFAWALAIVGTALELLCAHGILPALGGVVMSLVALSRGQKATGPLVLSLIVVALHLVLGRFL